MIDPTLAAIFAPRFEQYAREIITHLQGQGWTLLEGDGGDRLLSPGGARLTALPTAWSAARQMASATPLSPGTLQPYVASGSCSPGG